MRSASVWAIVGTSCAALAIACQATGDANAAAGLAFQAAWENDTQSLRELLAQDPDLANAEEPLPDSALNERFVRWVMGAGRMRILHVAARQGHVEVATLLLAAGAELDAPDRLVNTPLHLAAQYGHEDVARLLISAGADVNTRRNGGLTPLHLASSYGRYPVVKLLLDRGADVNARADTGWRPLHDAASKGHLNVTRLLLARGAERDVRTESGATPLRLAVSENQEEVVRLLNSRASTPSSAERGREE